MTLNANYYLTELTRLTPGQERKWPGGSGGLYAEQDCELLARPPDAGAPAPVGVGVDASGKFNTFTLPKGMYISLSADGWVGPNDYTLPR